MRSWYPTHFTIKVKKQILRLRSAQEDGAPTHYLPERYFDRKEQKYNAQVRLLGGAYAQGLRHIAAAWLRLLQVLSDAGALFIRKQRNGGKDAAQRHSNVVNVIH